MDGPLTTRAAVLQELRRGPAYGRDLIRRVHDVSGIRLGEGRVYPLLHQLRREGLVQAFRVVPGGRRGARARIFYELTGAGARASARDLVAIRALVAPLRARPSSAGEKARMAARLLEAEVLSEAGAALARTAMRPMRSRGSGA